MMLPFVVLLFGAALANAPPLAQLVTSAPNPSVHMMNISSGNYSVLALPFIGGPFHARILDSCNSVVFEGSTSGFYRTVYNLCTRAVVNRVNLTLPPGGGLPYWWSMHFDNETGFYVVPWFLANGYSYYLLNATTGTFSNRSDIWEIPHGGDYGGFSAAINVEARQLYMLAGTNEGTHILTFDLGSGECIHEPIMVGHRGALTGPMGYAGNRVLVWNIVDIWEVTPRTGIAVLFKTLPQGWSQPNAFSVVVPGTEYLAQLGCNYNNGVHPYCALLFLNPSTGQYNELPPTGVPWNQHLQFPAIAAIL